MHAVVEEEVVYPAIEAAVGGGDVLADRSYADHDEIKALLADIASADTDENSLVDALRALQLAVQAHVAIAESELVPAYRSVATTDDLVALTAAADKTRSTAAHSRS